jgi:hypothetical protein
MKPFSKLLLLTASLLVSACDTDSVKDTIGLSRKAPDEFRVVSRPPLSVPPEFNLRPPARPGETSGIGAEQPAHEQAKGLVMGNTSTEGGSVLLQPGTAATAVMPVTSGELETGADAQFLANARADHADGSIRDKLLDEAQAQSPEEQSMLDKLRDTGNNEPMVNAAEEQGRLEQNEKAGKPVTEGETPMVKPKDTGTLGRIFGY